MFPTTVGESESDAGKVNTESELRWTAEMHRDFNPYRLPRILHVKSLL